MLPRVSIQAQAVLVDFGGCGSEIVSINQTPETVRKEVERNKHCDKAAVASKSVAGGHLTVRLCTTSPSLLPCRAWPSSLYMHRCSSFCSILSVPNPAGCYSTISISVLVYDTITAMAEFQCNKCCCRE